MWKISKFKQILLLFLISFLTSVYLISIKEPIKAVQHVDNISLFEEKGAELLKPLNLRYEFKNGQIILNYDDMKKLLKDAEDNKDDIQFYNSFDNSAYYYYDTTYLLDAPLYVFSKNIEVSKDESNKYYLKYVYDELLDQYYLDIISFYKSQYDISNKEPFDYESVNRKEGTFTSHVNLLKDNDSTVNHHFISYNFNGVATSDDISEIKSINTSKSFFMMFMISLYTGLFVLLKYIQTQNIVRYRPGTKKFWLLLNKKLKTSKNNKSRKSDNNLYFQEQLKLTKENKDKIKIKNKNNVLIKND